uniref:NIPA-like protein n=1 Tax=Anthurium amnicola TaxID=1678845 RepID=A0A1D1YL68_9ARAE
MREEVISSGGTVDPLLLARSASPPPTTAASSAGASSPAVQTNVGSVDCVGSAHGSKGGSLSYLGSQHPRTSLSTNACGSALGSSQPSCRPWERADLLRRLATFKPSNWSGKPKAAGSLACARRGWMNIDIDKIECEICGAQLGYTPSTSWPAEADSAGEVFAEQLDAGHKLTCPWRGNCCADSLVQFPPTPPAALIGGYKDRCDGLLQFPSLPVIASSIVDKMRQSRGTQIDRFLTQSYASSIGELGFRVDNMHGMEFFREDALSVYYQAQKVISLCGWEPRWLPNVLDCEEHSAQSARNACSIGPTEDKLRPSQDRGFSKIALSTSVMKDTGKKKMPVSETRWNSRSPLLDCSVCGATVRILDFLTVPRPSRFGSNNIDTPETSKKLVLTRGISAASGISGWVATEGMEKDQTEDRDEAATTDEGKSLSNAGVDLNLTMAGGLPPTRFSAPMITERFDDGSMGRDLMIGLPSRSEVGDRAASYESRGPSTRKRSFEEGGSTVDRPQDRAQQADSIEATVIDRDGDEVDDSRQYSDGPSKRARGLDIFATYQSTRRIGPSGAGPSHGMSFDIDIDVNRTDPFREESDLAVGHPLRRDSTRASSVIAMDTICHSAEDDSMESVENYPGVVDDAHFSSPKNLDMNDAFECNYSNLAQQSTCLQPAAGSVAREMGVSSTNEGEEILNAETATAHVRDTFSIGISGGSVGMGASHEAEIHGVDFSAHRAGSVVGDAEPVAEVTENQGQTGESVPGPGLMGEFVPEEMDREDPQGDSQDVMSRSVVRADSGSKIYGSTKADSVESREKISHTFGNNSSAHPSLSCNAVIYSGYEVSKEEVTQAGKASVTDDCVLAESDYVGNGTANGENDYEVEAGEFDPLRYHNHFCPWVNGNVAAAGCSSSSSSSSSSTTALCGWQLTLDALDAYQSLGHIPNQTVESESAASLYKVTLFCP